MMKGMDMRKNRAGFNPKNIAQTSAVLLSASASHTEAGRKHIGKEREYKDVSDMLKDFSYHLYNVATVPLNWNERSLQYKTEFFLALIAIGGIAYASSDTVKKTVDSNAKKVMDTGKKISGATSGFLGLFDTNKPPVADFVIRGDLVEGKQIEIVDTSYDPDGKIVKNELRVDGKVINTPNQTLSPQEHEISLTVYDNGRKSAVKSEVVSVKKGSEFFDYWDSEFNVGVHIEGDDGVKNNIKNLIRTWKEVTPDDYKDKYPYAPKKIFVSNDGGFNAYGGSNDDDYISLYIGNEVAGSSNDLKTRINGVAALRAEWHNAKRSKNGVHFASGYDAEMDSNRAAAEYFVMTGVWTQEQADSHLEGISKRINPDGTYKN